VAEPTPQSQIPGVSFGEIDKNQGQVIQSVYWEKG